MRLINRILEMCEPAWEYLRHILSLCCVMAFCGFIAAVNSPFSIHTYEKFLLAKELASAPAGLLLIAAIATVCIEDAAGK